MMLIGAVAFLILGIVWLLTMAALGIVLVKHLDARRGRESRGLVVTLGVLLFLMAAAPLAWFLVPPISWGD